MATVSRRRFLLSASGAAIAVTLAPAVRAQPSVKIGTAVLGDYALAGPFIVAVEKGFFRAENLNVEFVPFRGGPNLVKAVIAGEILLGAAGSTDILVFREAGMRLDKVTPQWISQIQYVSEDAIKKQGDDIRKAMKGVFTGIKFMTEKTGDA